MALAIVQETSNSANGTDGASLNAHFPAGPTNGSLLVAIVMSWTSNASPGANLNSGWVEYAKVSSGSTSMYISVLYKYCGAGEPMLQAPSFGGFNFWAMSMWEISGVTGVVGTDIVAVHLNAADQVYPAAGPVLTTSFNSTNNSELILGGFSGNSGSNTFITSSTGTLDGAASNGGGLGPCHATGVHYVVPASGTAIQTSLSVTSGSSLESGFVELQSGSSVNNAVITTSLSGVSQDFEVNKIAGVAVITTTLRGISQSFLVAVPDEVATITTTLSGISQRFNAFIPAAPGAGRRQAWTS